MSTQEKYAASLGYQLAEKDIDLLLWLHAEAVWKAAQNESRMADAEMEFGSAMDEVDRVERENNDLRREVSRLRREVAFEALGADTFSGADELADLSSSVLPNGEAQ